MATWGDQVAPMVAVERIFSQHLRIFSLTMIYIVHQCSPMFTNVHQCSPSLIPRYSKISQVSHVLCGLDDLMILDDHDPNLPRSIQISDLPAFCHGTSFGSFHPALSQAQRLIRGVCVNVAGTHYTMSYTYHHRRSLPHGRFLCRSL